MYRVSLLRNDTFGIKFQEQLVHSRRKGYVGEVDVLDAMKLEMYFGLAEQDGDKRSTLIEKILPFILDIL